MYCRNCGEEIPGAQLYLDDDYHFEEGFDADFEEDLQEDFNNGASVLKYAARDISSRSPSTRYGV